MPKQAAKGRDFPFREDGQVYARVTKMLGNGRVLATCTHGEERLCTIRGSMRKREWVHVGDLVLVALREFTDAKADIIFAYTDAEEHRLKRLGEELVCRTTDNEEEAEEHVVEFEDGDDTSPDACEPVWEDI